MNSVGHLKTKLSLIAKTWPAEPLKMKLLSVSEEKGVRRMARPMMMEMAVKGVFANAQTLWAMPHCDSTHPLNSLLARKAPPQPSYVDF